MVHVQASKALHHFIGMTVEALVLKKMISFPRYIMAKRFHQLSFYLIKISQVLTELLIWIDFCSCDILMPKFGAFPPAKAGGV